ncbi:MAG: flagellar export chaperone FlgN [Pseudomonadota bacterium]
MQHDTSAIQAKLIEESEQLSALKTVLEAEASALDMDAIDELTTQAVRKRRLVRSLEDISRSWHQLLPQTESGDIAATLSGIDPSGQLRIRFEENLMIARACQQSNLENGLHVNRRHYLVQRSLQVLSGAIQGLPGIYTATGSSQSNFGQRPLGSA